MARIRVGIRSQAERLQRLAVAFAVELRLKIIPELYAREMSPKQFHEKFGGGSLSRVSRNFDRLVEHDWLKYMYSKGPGGDRRGSTEHFYRATELLYFDDETWAQLPYSVRVAFSWNLFGRIAEWLRMAVVAEMFGARPGSSLDTRTVHLDEIGRERVIKAVDRVFVAIFEEQDDAKLRAARTGEELVRVDVLQLAYDSPTDGADTDQRDGLVTIQEPLTPLPVRASKVFPDEICMGAIKAANEGQVSAKEFHEKVGGDLSKIRRRFRKAADNSWLKEVDWKTGGRRRGATEKFYRATRPAIAGVEELLAGIPDTLKATKAGRAFERVCSDFVEAMEAETIDRRTDRYVALSFLQFDCEGWDKVTAALDDLWALAVEEEKEAKPRLAKSGEEAIAMTLALGIYETPESEKEP